MLVNVVTVNMVKMTVMEVINMAVVLNGRVAAASAVLVRMIVAHYVFVLHKSSR